MENVKIPEKFKTIEGRDERHERCKAFEDMWLEGYEAGLVVGRAVGMVIVIEILMKNANMTLEQAMEILEIPEKTELCMLEE